LTFFSISCTFHKLRTIIYIIVALTFPLFCFFINQSNGPWSKAGTNLITFGQPVVGNSNFAAKHDELIPASKKVIFVNTGDHIAKMPVSVWFLGVYYKPYSGYDVLFKKFNSLISPGLESSYHSDLISRYIIF